MDEGGGAGDRGMEWPLMKVLGDDDGKDSTLLGEEEEAQPT
jgi:hypothetical protein